jgi:hypothetical protein
MASSKFFENASTITDDVDGITYRSIAYPLIAYLETDLKTYVIPMDQRYRPDKIADQIWSRPDLMWVLDYLNNFYHGFEEYDVNVEIKYLDKTFLQNSGIL